MRAGLLLPALLLAFPVAGEAQVAMTAETVIRGVVFDSLNMRPLAEATVQIAAASGVGMAIDGEAIPLADGVREYHRAQGQDPGSNVGAGAAGIAVRPP